MTYQLTQPRASETETIEVPTSSDYASYTTPVSEDPATNDNDTLLPETVLVRRRRRTRSRFARHS